MAVSGPPIFTLPYGKVWQTLNAGEAFLSAVCGESKDQKLPGVWGVHDQGGAGVSGSGGDTGEGVLGDGKNGVHGRSKSSSDSGVWGQNTGGGYGVSGSTTSAYQAGPYGTAAVWGQNYGTGTGVKGTSSGGDGVLGYSGAKDHAGVSAANGSGGMGLWAGGTPAGHFEGDVEVDGNVRVLGSGNVILEKGDLILENKDCAEDFDVLDTDGIDPGSVVVIDSEGALKQSHRAYDKRVAGVVSGAGDCRPGIILGRQRLKDNRVPVALIGRVYCKVDAGYSPIEVGDLLTTSPTPGHAMKASNPASAFGAVIGKALRPLQSGLGIVPILVALQ